MGDGITANESTSHTYSDDAILQCNQYIKTLGELFRHEKCGDIKEQPKVKHSLSQPKIFNKLEI